MLKNARFRKAVCVLTMLSVPAALLPKAGYAYNLSPVSFSQMYSLAQSGNVQALRASVRRGMNIDVMNPNGDTGLCIAAQRRDAYTYNSFRAAGANPRHPCTTKIDHYEDFVTSSKAVSVTATPREAFGAMGHESYELAPATWWILGGLAVGGGIAAIALGGGGGGGGSSDDNNNNVPPEIPVEKYDSLGHKLGAAGVVLKSTNGTDTNYEMLSHTNTKTDKITEIKFGTNFLQNAEYLDIILKAYDGGTYTNALNTKLQLGAGVVGMTAVNDSSVINDGYINADSYNATIGMTASNASLAVNNGSGIISGSSSNGIDLNFSGYNDDNTIIGMYADTKSTLINNGDIQGSAISAVNDPTASSDGDSSGETTLSSSSSSGTIVGMEAMILNVGTELNKDTITLQNNGNIDISAGDGGSDKTIQVNIIGMGSYLDDAFLNGSQNIRRAENVSLENTGTITLGYTGKYAASTEKTLRKGLGGIVGMRADANSQATNKGNININLADDNSGSSMAVAAGMQSVHGGELLNDSHGNIAVSTASSNARVTYGMIAVEGSGTVAGLYTNPNQSLTNNGKINMSTSNGYGMATYNGGTLVNNGNLTLGTSNDSLYNKNIGMYASGDSSKASLVNNGTIDVYSHNSVAMENDYAGATVITNDGTITIHENAPDSRVFGGNYTQAFNNGTINYNATSTSSGSSSSSDGFEFAVSNVVVSTKSTVFSGSAPASSSETELVVNNNLINLNASSFTAGLAVQTTQGTAQNKGTINLYDNSANPNTLSSIGMFLYEDSISSASIVNDGFINVTPQYSAAMASFSNNTAAVTNDVNGEINISGDRSYGIYSSGNSYIYNKGDINLYGDNATAIYSAGKGVDGVEGGVIIQNTGSINIYGDHATAIKVAGKAVIDRPGTIYVCQNGTNCSPTAEATLTRFYAAGDLTLKADFSIKDGTLIKTGESGTAKNEGNLTTSKGKIFDSEGGTSINNGSLNLIGSEAYGMYAKNNNTSTNNGTINVSASGSYGIYLGSNGTAENSGGAEINVSGANAYAVYLGNGSGEFTNAFDANISVSGNDSYAIYTQSGAGSITNAGTITVGSAASPATGSTAIYANNGVTAENSGTITVYGGNAKSYGMYAGNNASITNTGTIEVHGNGSIPSYGMYAASGASTATNSGSIDIYGSGSYGMYAESEGVAKNDGTITAHDGAIDENENVEDKKKEQEEKENGTSTASYSLMRAISGGTVLNRGTIITSAAMDFDAYTDGTGIIALGQNGTYKASSFSGTVVAGADVVQHGFDTVYVNKDSFVGTDNGLNILSGSYLFDAKKQINADGNVDVIMTMKSLKDTVSNQNLAAFLSDNYIKEKGEGVFNTLKAASSASAFEQTINRVFGFDFVPNLAQQSLDAEKNLNREITEDVLQKTDENIRRVVKAVTYKQDVDSKHEISGYKDKITAIYGFNDFKTGQNTRAGFGLAALRAESDYDNDSSRYNNVFEIYAPLSFQKENLALMVKPKAGFGRGHYRRTADSGVYKADTKEYSYGADTEARLAYGMGMAVVEPNIAFNLTGLYLDDIDESNNGLRLKAKNILSAQSVLGLDVKKKFVFNKDHALVLKAGGKYYHEFGNKYRTKATLGDMLGSYDIVDGRLQRNYGLLSVKAEYDYKNLSVSASANVPLEQKHNEYYLLGIGYKF